MVEVVTGPLKDNGNFSDPLTLSDVIIDSDYDSNDPGLIDNLAVVELQDELRVQSIRFVKFRKAE